MTKNGIQQRPNCFKNCKFSGKHMNKKLKNQINY